MSLTVPNRLRGLSAKLALFFIALALPALLLVQSTVVTLEFRELMRDVDAGALRRAAEREAVQLAEAGLLQDRVMLTRTLEAWLLRLTHPAGGISREAAYVLLELSDRPLSGAVYAPDGTWVAGDNDLPSLPPDALAAVQAGRGWDSAAPVPGREVRDVLVPIRDAAGAATGALRVRLDLPSPWRKVLLELGFEWPILVAYMAVFGIGSTLFLGWYVTGRLGRIADAAGRWSAGDFARGIADDSSDELGRLARDLDRMAGQLAEHVDTRARLATADERQRLARDLHDTVKQKMFALNLQIAAARGLLDSAPGESAARLGEAAHLVEEVQRELAAILHELRGETGEAALAVRAHRLADNWSRRSGIAVAWTRCDAVEAAPAIQEQVLRILEEALANAWRHSEADQVSLALAEDGARVSLTVTDNGRGIAGPGPGMGLDNMRARAGDLPRGEFRIGSTTPRGTRVEVAWRSTEDDDEHAHS